MTKFWWQHVKGVTRGGLYDTVYYDLPGAVMRLNSKYPETSNISPALVGNKIVDHSDVVGASSVGAAPTTSSFLTWHLATMDWAKATARRDYKHVRFGISCGLY